jgi:hypothetical protein
MYKIRYTEKTRAPASNYETKTLLYLLVMHEAKDDIVLFFIDCFNDITASDNSCEKFWDAQSKGVVSLTPRAIGTALITLYENFISDIDFIHSMLVIPKLKEGYLKEEDKKQFGISNFLDSQKKKISEGLLNEYVKREKKKITDITDKDKENIELFLKEVVFVIAEEKDIYIKEIIQFKNKNSLSQDFYFKIFDEIRDKQSTLKNINIEDTQINHPVELLHFNKHIKSNDIKLMVLNRFLGNELFEINSIPFSYIQEIQHKNTEDVKDLIQHNNSQLSLAFFNKNNKINFWRLLENILNVINGNKNKDIRFIYNLVNKSLIKQNNLLDEDSLLFFIALIKDGMEK